MRDLPFLPGAKARRDSGLEAVAVALAAVLVLPAVAVARPLDFTPEERTLFTEAKQDTRRTQLPQVANFGGVAGWADDTRVVLSTREIEGAWKAGAQEPARVVILDARAKTVQETGYRGNLVCFAAGTLLVAQPRSPEMPGFRPTYDRLVGGRLGEPLQEVTEVAGRAILPYSCALNPIGLPGADTGDVPLLRGDGMLRLPRPGGRGTATGGHAGYELYDSSGRLVTTMTGAGYPVETRLHYVPWLHAYFSDKGTSSPSDFIWPDGRRRTADVPPLLASLARMDHVGSADAIPARPGLLWNLVTWRSFWRMQGLYLQGEDGVLRRVDDASVATVPRPAVSPDGCNVFYFRKPGDPYAGRSPYIPTVLHFC